jgi:hypothetical protein
MAEPEITNPAPEPESGAAAPADPEPGAPGGESDGSAGRSSFADAITDFVQLITDYVRQETGEVVRSKVVLPTQKAGQVVAFALAAAMVLVLGICFISAGLLIVLAGYVGWPAALVIVGAALSLGAAGLSYAKTRSMQR